MEVKAIFELPVPIWLMTDALDTTYPSGFRALHFDVAMPRGAAPAGEPPQGFEPVPQPSPDGSDEVQPTTVWTQEYGAFIPESLKPATTVQRVGIVEADGPVPAHLTWFTPDHQLAEYINPWFDQVRTLGRDPHRPGSRPAPPRLRRGGGRLRPDIRRTRPRQRPGTDDRNAERAAVAG